MKKDLLVITNSGKLTEELTILLSSLGNVGEIITFKKWANDYAISIIFVPDVVIYDDTTPVDFKRYNDGLPPRISEYKLVFDYCRYKSKIKFFGFGMGGTFLALLNNCDILQEIENHDIEHMVTFILDGYDTIQTIIPSSHDTIMYPINNMLKNFEIKAFSTYNKSNKYKNRRGKFIKMHDKFVEPEIITFSKGRCVAFQYNPPAITERLAFSLTLENMKV